MNTLDVKALPATLLTLCFTMIAFFAVDNSIRFINPEKDSGAWGITDLTEKMQLLDEHYKKHGRIDVLAVGSSVVSCVDAGLWQRATKDELICFNLGVGGVEEEPVEFFMREHVIPKYHPKHIVYPEHPRSILANRYKKYPFPPAFWNSNAVQSLLPQPWYRRISLEFEKLSYITQRKHSFRADLLNPQREKPNSFIAERMNQYGLLNERSGKVGHPEDYINVNEASIDMSHNLPAIGRLAAFCKEQGISLDVVNQDFVPNFWNRFPVEVKTDYKDLLRYMAGKQSFYDASIEIPLTGNDFLDTVHMNIWGMEKMDLYIFNKIISPNYYSSKYRLAEAEFLPFAQLDNQLTGDFAVQQTSHLTSSKYQLVAETPHSKIDFTKVLSPGTYEFSVWAYNETTAPVTEKHNLDLQLVNTKDRKTIAVTPLQIATHWGPYLPATAQMTVPENVTATVSVKVNSIAPNRRLILDMLSVRPMSIDENITPANEATTHSATLPYGVSLITNGDFSKPADAATTQAIAHKWVSYGKNIVREADNSLTIRALNDDLAPVTQWNSLIENNPDVCGKRVKFTVHAKTFNNAVFTPSILFDEPTTSSAKRRIKYMANKATESADKEVYEVEFAMPPNPVSGFTVDFRLRATSPKDSYVNITGTTLLTVD